MKKLGLQRKLTVLFVIIILTFVFANGLTYMFYNQLTQKYEKIVDKFFALNNILDSLEESQSNLEIYLTSKTSLSGQQFNSSMDALYKNINFYYTDMLDTDVDYIAYHAISGLLINYNEKTDEAIWGMRGRNAGASLESFNESSTIAKYIAQNVEHVLLRHLTDSYREYSHVTENTRKAQVILIFYFGLVTLYGIGFGIRFIRKIANPLSRLTKAAQDISSGNRNVHIDTEDLSDEVGILSNAFNIMASSIKRQLEELEQKAETELKLVEKSMENLQMTNLLRETELKMLQSQINPHFLFNVLNCIAQTSWLENADKTAALIEVTSDMLKYNLQKMTRSVKLRDEISQMQRYIYIQRQRFGERVSFGIFIESDSCLEIDIPCLSLQPIVENAFMHGLESQVNQGMIYVKVYEEDNHVFVSIWDNGKGMTKEKQNEIIMGLDRQDGEDIHGQTTGIGLKNVIQRLRRFYNEEDVIHIVSTPGQGTEIILKLYKGRRKDV